MRRGSRWVGLCTLVVAAGLFAVGCTRSATRKNGPPDPLLLSKQPAQAKYGPVAQSTARPDPIPPTMPTNVWVASPYGKPSTSARLGAPDLGPAARPVPGAPVSWSSDRPVTPDFSQASLYARSADFRWVQGVLEKAGGDQWLLRYDPAGRDSHGGRVLLEGHPRLDLFQPGDVIRVEGAMSPGAAATWIPHPRYQVQSVQLVQRQQ